ncbi:MAG: hypothetical protein AB7E52_05130 [Bdellovibrionales bacterium]
METLPRFSLVFLCGLCGALLAGCMLSEEGEPSLQVAQGTAAPVVSSKMPDDIEPVALHNRVDKLVSLTLNKKQLKAVYQGVRDALKDPDSAKFYAMKAGKDPSGVITVCGLVNAKNGFGGYTGKKPFIGVIASDNRLFIPLSIGGKESELSVTYSLCRDYGLSLFP